MSVGWSFWTLGALLLALSLSFTNRKAPDALFTCDGRVLWSFIVYISVLCFIHFACVLFASFHAVPSKVSELSETSPLEWASATCPVLTLL